MSFAGAPAPTLEIARVFGIPIRLHWSFWLLVLGFVAAGAWLSGPPGAVAALVGALILFVSVALHELGHAIAARRYGIATQHITLYPFGGVAAIEGMPDDPGEELIIALAGPAVNFLLVAVFGWGWIASGWGVLSVLVAVNAMMGAFNLIPAFPMDGGRVLRALLARRMGWVPASMLSIRIGRVFAVLFVVGGVWFTHVGLIMVGAFLLVALASEKQRLINVVWERAYYGQDDWRHPNTWGGRRRADPRGAAFG